MRPFRAFVVAVVAALCCSMPALAAPQLTLSDSSGDSSSVTIVQGGSFTIDVILTADTGFTGLTYFLETTSGGSGNISITGRTSNTWTGNGLTDSITSDPGILALFDATLSPRNGKDLGYSATDVSTNIAPGTYSITSLTLASTASTPAGDYTIRTASATLTDAQFSEFSIPVSSYTVHVMAVPEAASLTLLGLGAMSLPGRLHMP
jgi:hypothetical protein